MGHPSFLDPGRSSSRSFLTRCYTLSSPAVLFMLTTKPAFSEPDLPGLAVVPPPDEQTRQDAIGRSALRKASLHLLPLIGLGYGIAFMDRVNISFAALQMNRNCIFQRRYMGWARGCFF